MGFDVHTLKKVELPFKIALAEQIGRIAELFSTKVDVSGQNIAQSQKIIIDAQEMAVDTLETMMSPYQDKAYKDKKDTLSKESKIRLRQENAMKKFGYILEHMARKHMLMESVLEEIDEEMDSELEEAKGLAVEI